MYNFLTSSIVYEVNDEIEDESKFGSEALPESKLAAWLTQITRYCQQILKSLFFLKEPMIELTKRMGGKNKHTADNQKYKFIKQKKSNNQVITLLGG